jgi:septum formation protein
VPERVSGKLSIYNPSVAARRLVLASGSPRRRQLAARLGGPFVVLPAQVDEAALPGEPPHAYALRLAEAKARAVEAADGLVVGADTIVIDDGEVLGKPADAAQALEFLRRLRGREHEVATAVAVLDAASGEVRTGIETTAVWMRDYSDEEMRRYVDSGDPLDKAGAYAIQSSAFRPVARIRGSRSNVIGLPLELTARLLAEFDKPEK